MISSVNSSLDDKLIDLITKCKPVFPCRNQFECVLTPKICLERSYLVCCVGKLFTCQIRGSVSHHTIQCPSFFLLLFCCLHHVTFRLRFSTHSHYTQHVMVPYLPHRGHACSRAWHSIDTCFYSGSDLPNLQFSSETLHCHIIWLCTKLTLVPNTGAEATPDPAPA